MDTTTTDSKDCAAAKGNCRGARTHQPAKTPPAHKPGFKLPPCQPEWMQHLHARPRFPCDNAATFSGSLPRDGTQLRCNTRRDAASARAGGWKPPPPGHCPPRGAAARRLPPKTAAGSTACYLLGRPAACLPSAPAVPSPRAVPGGGRRRGQQKEAAPRPAQPSSPPPAGLRGSRSRSASRACRVEPRGRPYRHSAASAAR